MIPFADLGGVVVNLPGVVVGTKTVNTEFEAPLIAVIRDNKEEDPSSFKKNS